MAKETLTLEHYFDPGLSGIGAKLLVIKPYEVFIEINYEVGKDLDNADLRRDLSRLWANFCTIRAKKFKKEVALTAKLIFAKVKSLQDRGVTSENKPAFIINQLEQVVSAQNLKMSDAFDSWKEGFLKEVSRTVNDWGQINNDAVKVRAKRVGKIVKGIASIAHSIVNPASIKGKVKIVTKVRDLYKDLKSTVGKVDKRARNVVSEINSLIKVTNTMDRQNTSAKFIKWSAQVNSIGSDLERALGDYDDEVKLLKSKVKKLGTKLRKIKAADEAHSSTDVQRATQALETAQVALEGHIFHLGATTKKFTAMKAEHVLQSAPERTKKAFKKKATSGLSSLRKGFDADRAVMSNVYILDESLATLDNGLERNIRGASIDI